MELLRFCFIIWFIFAPCMAASSSAMTLKLMTSSNQTSLEEFQVYRKETFQLINKYKVNKVIKEINFTLHLPVVTSQWVFEPLLDTYQFSNMYALHDDVKVTSDIADGTVTFMLKYSEPPADTIVTHLELLAEECTTVDAEPIYSSSRALDYSDVMTYQSMSSRVTVRCVGPYISMTSLGEKLNSAIRVGDVINDRIRFEHFDRSTEEARDLQFRVQASRGIVSSKHVTLMMEQANKPVQRRIMEDFLFGKWISYGDLPIHQAFTLQLDGYVTNDVILNSDVVIEVSVTYTSKSGIQYEDSMVIRKPTERIQLQTCDVTNPSMIFGKQFDITVCLIMPPGTINLDLTIALSTNNHAAMRLMSGDVTSRYNLLSENFKAPRFRVQGQESRIKRQTSSIDTWNVGNVTNAGNRSDDVIIAAQILPISRTSRDVTMSEGTLIVSMNPLGRILQRNVIVSSAELNLTKLIEIVDTANNPDIFRITLLANTLSGNTLYNVIIRESIQGLAIVRYNNPTDQSLLTTQNDEITYNAGNLTSVETLQFGYDATLASLGAEVGSQHPITTSVGYSTTISLQTRVVLNATVCINKTTSSTSTPCIWCSVLVIIACLFAGFLLVFLVLLILLLLSKSFPTVVPFQQKKDDKEPLIVKREHCYYDVTNIAEALTKDNENEMFKAIEMLEFQRLLELQRTIDQETMDLTKNSLSLILEQNKESLQSNDDVTYLMQNARKKRKKKTIAEEVNHAGLDVAEQQKKEMQEWEKKLADYPEKFQEEMMSLIKQRHAYEVTKDRFVRNLKETAKDFEEELDDVTDVILNTIKEERTDNDDVIIEFRKNQNFLLEELVAIFSDYVTNIHQATQRRDDVIVTWGSNLAKEKKIWNKIASKLTDVYKIAERQDLISYEDRKKMSESALSHMKKAKENFENELEKIRKEILKNHVDVEASKRHSIKFHVTERDGDDINDVTEWLKFQLKRIKRELKDHITVENELDKSAFQMVDSLATVMSQTRKEIEKGRSKVKIDLMNKGVDEHWLDDIFLRHDNEIQDFSDVTAKSENLLIEKPNRFPCFVNEGNLELLRKILAVQPVASPRVDMNVIEAEIGVKKVILQETIREQIKRRIRQYDELAEKNKSLLDDVTVGDDEESIRKELEQKFKVVSGDVRGKTKKLELREKRHQSITSHRHAKRIVGEALRHQLSKTADLASTIRDSRAIEDLLMAFLEVLTSSGDMTPSECKSIMQEYRTQADDIKRNFKMERKRKEEIIKRKTELSSKKRRDNLKYKFHEEENKLSSLLELTDEQLRTSSHVIDDERSSIQELFQLRSEVVTEQERALMKQDLRMVRGLSKETGAGVDEMKKMLQMLLPQKSLLDIEEMSRVLCPERSKKRKGKTLRSLVARIEHIIMETQNKPVREEPRRIQPSRESERNVASHKLSPLVGSTTYREVRPEPIGRTASPVNESSSRYDRYNRNFDQQ